MCDAVHVSHLYEYQAVTKIIPTDDFALTKATACSVYETRTYESDANSSTVFAYYKTIRAGNYTIVPDNNTLNRTCEQCEAGIFKEAEGTNTVVLDLCTDCVAAQCAEGKEATNCTFCPAVQYQDAARSTNCMLCTAGMQEDAVGQTECKVCDAVHVSHLCE